MASIFIISLVGVYFLGWIFARNALSPISNLIKQVSKMGASNLHLRVREGKRKDEIGELARTFNNLISRLEESFEIQKAFVSGASHEFRTPITSLIGEIEVGLSKPRDNQAYIEILEKILEQAEKLNEITASLLNLTRTGNEFSNKEPVRLDQLIYDAIESLPPKWKPERIELSMNNLPDDPSELIVLANKNLLVMALGNILSNALKFSHGNKVNCTLFQNESKSCISIEDKGMGIREEDLNKIFQPFYRGQNAQGLEGTGIGLSLSEKIIKMYKGNIWVQSKIDLGTRFEISFPKGIVKSV
jgi:signal transduction histidine kinase